MQSSLDHLLEEGIISEVLAQLQSGKEAEVYVVRYGSRVVAAKVYKERSQRNFKNNAIYTEGRSVRNSRSQRAMDRGSRFGKTAAENAWKSAEANALYALQDAGVRVPAPVMFVDGVLLMELVLDGQGNAARRLIDTELTPAQANLAYHDMVTQLVRMLTCDLIHGDLSPYNVLWAWNGPVVIDFPQTLSASHNNSSERLFRRDAETILGHFARIDRSLLARRGDVAEIWQAYVRRELSPDFRPTGRVRHAPPPARPVVPRVPPESGPSPRSTQGAPQDSRRVPNVSSRRRGVPGHGPSQPPRVPEVIIRPARVKKQSV